MDEYRKIEKLGYRIVRELKPSSCEVYLLNDFEEREYVLKMPDFSGERNEYNYCARHVSREIDLLLMFEGLNGIPNIVEYLRGNYPVHFPFLIREYVRGYTGREQEIPKSCAGELFEIVNAIHSKGFAGLDIANKSIVVNEDGKPFIFDLGSAKKYKIKSNFWKAVEEDLLNLRVLF